jgi:hypothetical protein
VLECWSDGALAVQRQLIGNIHQSSLRFASARQPTSNIQSAEPPPNSMFDVSPESVPPSLLYGATGRG